MRPNADSARVVSKVRGVTAAARSVGVWRGERAAKSLAKWRSAARESGKQSRRAWLPDVTPLGLPKA